MMYEDRYADPYLLMAGATLALGVLTSCLASPRSGDQLAHADDTLRVEGTVEHADQAVQVEVYDHRHARWSALTSIEPNELVRTETPLGVGYRFSTEIALPASADFFAAGRDARSMRTQLRARQGGQALASFDASAEQCLRTISDGPQDRTQLATRALSRCAARGSPAVELVIAHCGGEGESCCAHFGAAPQSECSSALSCTGRRCERPAYSVPLIAGHTEDLAVSKDAHLREAYLELDDSSVGGGTRVTLVAREQPQPGVELTRPQRDVLRMRFDVPLWQVGHNRFRVVALVDKGLDGKEELRTPLQTLDYDPGARLGHLDKGLFQLPARHFPMRMSDCRGPNCKDRDGDGLNDLWENVALNQLRPRLMLDADDGVFRTKDAVRVLSSVVPLTRGGRDYVLFAHVVTFSRDFGPPGLPVDLSHAGDTEAFGMAFTVSADGTLRWASSVAKGHDCLTCKSTWHWHSQDFDGDGAPLVYVEEGKHGLWQNRAACQHDAGFDCDSNHPLRPAAINTGNPSADGTGVLVDVLDDVDPAGPHAALAGVFPGEAMWSAGRARMPGRFCGGRTTRCTRVRSAKLAGDVMTSVVERFEHDHW